MDADLDTLCTVVYCTADDLLPEARNNARRRTTDAEMVTLCVAQVDHGHPFRPALPATARRQLGHLFPVCPPSPPTSSAGAASRTPSSGCSSTSPRRARVSTTTCCSSTRPRSNAAEAGDGQALGARRRRRLRLVRLPLALLLGLCACTCLRPRRYAPGVQLASPKRDEREVGSRAAARCTAAAGRCSSATRATRGAIRPPVAELGATVVRPARKDEPGHGPHLAPIRQRIESIFWTCKDLLTFERHGARTMAGLRERILARFLCLAACISLNHRLGRPSRALARLLRLRLGRGINHLGPCLRGGRLSGPVSAPFHSIARARGSCRRPAPGYGDPAAARR